MFEPWLRVLSNQAHQHFVPRVPPGCVFFLERRRYNICCAMCLVWLQNPLVGRFWMGSPVQVNAYFMAEHPHFFHGRLGCKHRCIPRLCGAISYRSGVFNWVLTSPYEFSIFPTGKQQGIGIIFQAPIGPSE